MGWAERILRLLHRLEDTVLALLLGAMIALGTLQIILRNGFDSGLIWIDPLLKVMVLWLGLLGALAATRDDKHITIDILSHWLPPLARRLAYVGTRLFAAAVCGVIAWHSLRFVSLEIESESIAFSGIPAWLFETVIPFSFALIAVRFLLHALRGLTGASAEDKA